MHSSRRIVAIVAVALLAVGCSSEPLPPPPSSPADRATPSPVATLAAAGPSASVAAEPAPRVSVADAVAIRDAGVDRRELDVAGFLSPFPRLPCALVLAERNPARVDCPYSFQWLMANPERLQAGSTFGPPSGAAFHPSFALVEAPDVPQQAGSDSPLPVELVGHFDDRRAALCPRDPEPVVPCADAFVVDQVATVDNQAVGAATSEDLDVDDGNGGSVRLQPASTVGDIDRQIAAVDPGAVVLSRRVTTTDRLRSVEPTYTGVGLGARIVWTVVTLDPASGPPPVARTFLLPDGGKFVMRMTDDNRVSLVLPASRPDQTVLCGRLNVDRCAAAIALVRADHRDDVDTAWRIAVDDTCPPPSACDRKYPFDSLVVLVRDPAPASAWTAYQVVGLGEEPEHAGPYLGQVPAHILDLAGVGIAPVPAVQAPGAS